MLFNSILIKHYSKEVSSFRGVAWKGGEELASHNSPFEEKKTLIGVVKTCQSEKAVLHIKIFFKSRNPICCFSLPYEYEPAYIQGQAVLKLNHIRCTEIVNNIPPFQQFFLSFAPSDYSEPSITQPQLWIFPILFSVHFSLYWQKNLSINQ